MFNPEDAELIDKLFKLNIAVSIHPNRLQSWTAACYRKENIANGMAEYLDEHPFSDNACDIVVSDLTWQAALRRLAATVVNLEYL